MSSNDDLIRKAIEAIGDGNPGEDWKVAPSEHAALLESSAPSLERNLRGARAGGLAEMHEELDAKADSAQRLFKRTIGRTNAAIFMTASLAAGLLIAGSLQGFAEDLSRLLICVFSIAGAICSAAAAMWLAAASSALKRSTSAVFVASIVTGVVGVLAFIEPGYAALAGASVIASAYAAFAASRTAVNMDHGNAERYRDVKDKLQMRKLEIDDFRVSTANGDARAPSNFFEPIFIALEADHKAFLCDAEQRELAIGSMAQQLDAETRKLKGSASAGPSGQSTA